MTTDRNRLTQFILYLTRDHLPAGVVAQIISQLSDEEILYDNEHLENLCNDYARRILEG
jgi:hypothetical protein